MFGPFIRMNLAGPVTAVMFWLYAFAITRTGVARYLFGVPFMAVNCLYNVTCGSFIFWELPREWFFTDRLKRHKRSPRDEDRLFVATSLCREMNKFDPDHC